MRGATAAADTAFAGTRPLSSVLEQRQVIRKMRDASLAEAEVAAQAEAETARKQATLLKPEVVWAIRDKQVVALPVIKLTPKLIRFDAGARTQDGRAMHAYAYRDGFESGRYGASIRGCPATLNGIEQAVYRTRELADRALTDRLRGWPRARATAGEEQVIRAAHRAMDLRGRGKSGVHTTTEACRMIRDLLDVLAAITGIDSADPTLPVLRAGGKSA